MDGRVRNLAVVEKLRFSLGELDTSDVHDRDNLCALDHLVFRRVICLGGGGWHRASKERGYKRNDASAESFYCVVHRRARATPNDSSTRVGRFVITVSGAIHGKGKAPG